MGKKLLVAVLPLVLYGCATEGRIVQIVPVEGFPGVVMQERFYPAGGYTAGGYKVFWVHNGGPVDVCVASPGGKGTLVQQGYYLELGTHLLRAEIQVGHPDNYGGDCSRMRYD